MMRVRSETHDGISFEKHDATSEQEGHEPLIKRYKLIIFQAKPLVYIRDMRCHALTRHPDFRYEREAIRDAVKTASQIDLNAQIDVEFQPATINRLVSFIAAGDSHMLHLSGHANVDCLAMESDEGGELHYVQANDLVELISNGPGTLQFVFISTCYSRGFGEALVKAGVKHVLCCYQSESLMKDAAAIIFERHFYGALARGNHLRRAFDLAQAAVTVSLPVEENQKFVLLPENPSDKAYHDVHIFYRFPQPQGIVPSIRKQNSSSHLPPEPQFCIGREIETHKILKAASRPALIQIMGRRGIGKSTLAKYACNYIFNRKCARSLDDVFWLPPLDHSYDGDPLSTCFREVMESSANDFESMCKRYCGNLIAHFRKTRALIFIDAGGREFENAMDKLQMFVEIILRGTENVSVVLVCPPNWRFHSTKVYVDLSINLGPLTMETTATLFALKSEFVESGPGKLDEFVNLLVPKSQADSTCINSSMSKRCAEIFSMIGEGIPERIGEAAEDMTSEGFESLMKIGMRAEFEVKIETRVVLEQEVRKHEKKLASARGRKDYSQAEENHSQLQELYKLRQNLKSLAELRVEEAGLAIELDDASISQEFSRAVKISKNVEKVRNQIRREEKANMQPPKKSALSENEHAPNEHAPLSWRQDPGVLWCAAKYKVPSSGEFGNGASFSVAISHGSIVDFSYHTTDAAIVCCTNESLFPLPGGANSAVLQAGGTSLAHDLAKLPSVSQSTLGTAKCRVGEAKLVGPGSYNSLQVDYVIFTVGPAYVDIEGGGKETAHTLQKSDELLRSSYKEALALAKDRRLKAVAFSLVSAGSRAGTNSERPLRIGLDTICSFEGYDELEEIHLCAYESLHFKTLTRIAGDFGLGAFSHATTLTPRNPSSRSMLSWLRRFSNRRDVSPRKIRYICPAQTPRTADSFVLVASLGCVSKFSYSNRKAAIVCATNESVVPIQGSVDAAVVEAGGSQLTDKVKSLTKVGENEWGGIRCPTGDARIVGPHKCGNLQTDYVIFAVGPTYSAGDGNISVLQKDAQLRSAYQASLDLAKAARLEAIGFSMLSAGKRAGGNYSRPLHIAVDTISKYSGYKELKEVRLCGYLPREIDALNKELALSGLSPASSDSR